MTERQKVGTMGTLTDAIVYPLRSNTTWFGSTAGLDEFDRRLKLCAMLYETVVFEDGRLITVGGATGTYSLRNPPVEDRSKIEFHQVGAPFSLRAGADGQPLGEVFGGPSEFSFTIDFYPVVAGAGLLKAPWIKTFEMPALNQEQDTWVRQMADADRRNESLVPMLPENFFLRGALLQGLYADSLVLGGSRVVAIAPELGSIVEWKNRQELARFTPDLRMDVLASSFHLKMPNFAEKSWEEIDKIRDSAPAQDFRRLVKQIVSDVRSSISQGATHDEVEREISHKLMAEAGEELIANRKGGATSVAIDLVSNFIPALSALSMGKTVAEAAEARSSWVALLGK